MAFCLEARGSDSQCSIYTEYHYIPPFNVTLVELGSTSSMYDCIQACNEDENCTDFVIQRRNSNSDDDDINCYVNNGTGNLSLCFVPNTESFRKRDNLHDKQDPSGCPTSFSPLPCDGTRGGCYHVPPDFTARRLSFEAAEAACQRLNSRAHVVHTETLEVTQG